MSFYGLRINVQNRDVYTLLNSWLILWKLIPPFIQRYTNNIDPYSH